MKCNYCHDEERPCCADGKCTAEKTNMDFSNCICCGAEMQKVNGYWYHWSQIGYDGLPEYPDAIQLYEY